MKKTMLLALALCLGASGAWAQTGVTWFTLGAKGGYGTSYFFNGNHINDDLVGLVPFNQAFSFGGRFALNFTAGQRSHENNLNLGVEFGASRFGQRYELQPDPNTTESYTKDFAFGATDLSVLLRYTGQYGGFFELGPTFSTLKAEHFSQENSGPMPAEPLPFAFEDFAAQRTALSMGFGIAPVKTTYVDLELGLRFSYTLTDFMAQEDALMAGLANDGVFVPAVPYEQYRKTSPLVVQATLMVNYYMGYFGVASCRKPGLKLFSY